MRLKDNWLSKEYINKPIARIMVVILVGILVASYYIDGFNDIIVVECKGDKVCSNILYVCQVGETPSIDNCQPRHLNSVHKKLCDEGKCERYLQPGEKIGKSPSWITKHRSTLLLTTMFIAFLINQTIYFIKHRKRILKKIRESDFDILDEEGNYGENE